MMKNLKSTNKCFQILLFTQNKTTEKLWEEIQTMPLADAFPSRQAS